ncbi:N-acetylmuramoyl-L-alanine amidase domain-containing protein [Aspergillus cavernicola]|uniref:N-acetylmuramoyl-L-alanine amidase domain-containing protein n=1 Tax=Aspergillus cavernicola TaxID=176166 RepID=A0ABR4I9S7_9EURO
MLNLLLPSSTLATLATLAIFTLLPPTTGMYFIPRANWSATPALEPYTPVTNPLGIKVHYIGPSYTSRAHSQCGLYMKSIQDMHMANTVENYIDIAYNLAVCEHGYVYEGRGVGHRSGANGDTVLNAEHYAVLAFLGKAGLSEPTGDQIVGIQDSIAYLRRGGAGVEILGHRDGYDTECPGEELYALVEGGRLDPGEELWDGGVHVVRSGETVEGIAEEYGVPGRYIVFVNGLAEGGVSVGGVIEIPARGVPLDEVPAGGGDGEDGEGYEAFPGGSWFKTEPSSPIIEAMGKRLVEEDCGKYSSAPGQQWTDEDLASYQCWQEQLGYTGADADGWPGQVSWVALKVPAA